MTRKTRVAFAAAVVIGGALFAAGTGAIFCRATLQVTRRLGPTPPNAKTVSIIAGDKASLSAWWLRTSKPNGNCVIVLHGIGDSRAGSIGFAPMFLNEGYSVLVPDTAAAAAAPDEFRRRVICWFAQH